MTPTTLKQPVITEDGERILRYRPGQRYVHLLVAVTFVALFLTGLPLIFEPLAFLAAGGWSRILHRVAAVGFMAVPLLYFIVDREGMKELLKESFTYDKDDLRWLSHMGRYFLGNAADMPPQGRLNAGQKLHHAAVIILGAGVVFSGVFVWASAGTMSDTLLSWSMLIHNVSMIGLVLLLIGHIYFTVVYKALTSMHTGYVPKADAEIEHPKWVAEIEAQEAEARAAQQPSGTGGTATATAADDEPAED